jgi:peptidoglycan/LPS O-acetylase OafA/YrhL
VGARTLTAQPSRLEWLDGVRAAAAFFVLLHHVWLAAFAARTFPVSNSPPSLTVLGYGHLAVAVFIVVSGFSLGLAPARHGRRLDSATSFARRRAWRILPPYWTALVLSVIVVTFVLGPGRVSGQTWRTLLVHGLLLQDVVPSTVPNGTFWSIAVESQIYVLFPLLVWVWRRWGAALLAVTVTLAVVAAHIVGQAVPTLDGVEHLTPQFLALFVFGMVAAGLVADGSGRPMLSPLAAAGLAGTAAVMGVAGIVRMVAA